MYVDKEIRALKEKRGSRTGVAFILGAILGSVVGADLIVGIIAGIVAGVVVWMGYNGDIEKKENRRTINGD